MNCRGLPCEHPGKTADRADQGTAQSAGRLDAMNSVRPSSLIETLSRWMLFDLFILVVYFDHLTARESAARVMALYELMLSPGAAQPGRRYAARER